MDGAISLGLLICYVSFRRSWGSEPKLCCIKLIQYFFFYLFSSIMEMILHYQALIKLNSLCRNWPSQPTILKGHTDGVSSFSVWGQDVISIARNKIGLSSLSKSGDEVNNTALYHHFLLSTYLICMTWKPFGRMGSRLLHAKNSTWLIMEQETFQFCQA